MGAVINTSNVNIEASNGIIHYVDQVVGHIQNGSLLQTAQRIPSLSELLKGIAVANLTDVLSGNTLGHLDFLLHRTESSCRWDSSHRHACV